MNLYLSSYGLGNEPERLLKLIGLNKLCGIIANAQDHKEEDVRAERLEHEKQQLSEIGIQSEELDLREYFGKPDALAHTLGKYGLLWVPGGNVFVLRKAMAMSGLDVLLPEIIKEEKVVYAGYSAGVCVLAPHMRGIELVDDATLTPPGYPSEVIWDGLDVLPYEVAPHYKSNHPESSDIDKVVDYFRQHDIPYKTLRDGEALVINGNEEFITGFPNG